MKVSDDANDKTILDNWHVSAAYLTKVVDSNPSLRGMILGYLAEAKLFDVFNADPRVTALRKDDDHDRKRKGDLVVTYQGYEFKIEVKSLQTNSIKINASGTWISKIIKQNAKYLPSSPFKEAWRRDRLSAVYEGTIQCDASDRRTVQFDSGHQVETTCLKVGEFEVLAACLFGFRHEWDFAFALNTDLPRSTHKRYPPEVQAQLLKSLIPITWPIAPPFTAEPFALLDQLIQQRARSGF